MSVVTSGTPSPRAHAFINHSPETYEARLRHSHEVKEEENQTPVKSRSGSRCSSTEPSQSDSDMQMRPAASKTSEPTVGSMEAQSSPASSHSSSQSSSSSSQASLQSAQHPPTQSNREKEAPRKRRRTSPDELQILETEFSLNAKPCREDRERIASLTNMDEKAVQVWFQNKRQSCRRQQNQENQMPAHVSRLHSMPASFQTEKPFKASVQMMAISEKVPLGSKAAGTNIPSLALSAQPTFSVKQQQPRNPKSLKLSMSADGKAELVERSPLKQIQTNRPLWRGNPAYTSTPTAPSAMRFATMPSYSAQLSCFEQECASSLLVLKSGQWR